MNYKDVRVLIEEGEGFEVEFKRRVSAPEKIARTLIAFANTRGGHMLFGSMTTARSSASRVKRARSISSMRLERCAASRR